VSQGPSLAELSGAVTLSPGVGLPSIQSTRPELASRVLAGQLAADIPALVASLYTLCGHAHQFTARRAVDAARGLPADCSVNERQSLRAGTERDQLMRIAHDWPRLLPGTAPAGPAPLRSNPLWRSELTLADQLHDLPAWLQQHWLGMPVTEWLRQHDRDAAQWPWRWAIGHHTSVARTLSAHWPAASALATATAPLALLNDPQRSLPELAKRMAATPAYCAEPDWHGTHPDTGPWSRLHCPLQVPATNAATRLVARLVDLLRLAAPDGPHWLAHGAMPLGPREGMAWTEMSRGLLVHWVRLDGTGEAARTEAYRVLAPTEWNFHPRGVLAQALSALRGPQAADNARTLAVAFDPCVEFTVNAPPQATGALRHA
jgi:hypothetical protein